MRRLPEDIVMSQIIHFRYVSKTFKLKNKQSHCTYAGNYVKKECDVIQFHTWTVIDALVKIMVFECGIWNVTESLWVVDELRRASKFTRTTVVYVKADLTNK